MIEIQGDTHATADQAAYGEARTGWLEERGNEVIGLSARQFDRNLEDVVEANRRACVQPGIPPGRPLTKDGGCSRLRRPWLL